MRLAFCFARLIAGINIPIKMPMIPMTTSNSTSVNPPRRRLSICIPILSDNTHPQSFWLQKSAGWSPTPLNSGILRVCHRCPFLRFCSQMPASRTAPEPDSQNSDATMAVYLDLENIALGAHDAHFPAFDIQKVLERLLLKGHIVVKKAYCDFDRYKTFKRDLHEAAFEMIEIPHVRQSGKNSADIRMVVDALDLCYTKGHVDTFVIISGDSDFSPLVSKLRENSKTVIGIAVKNSTSDLFLNNCDDFIYYDDLVRSEPAKARRRPPVAPAGKTTDAG